MEKEKIKDRIDEIRGLHRHGIDVGIELEILSKEIDLSILRDSRKTVVDTVSKTPLTSKKSRKSRLLSTAIEMRKSGLSIRNIATVLDTPKSTIEAWTKDKV